MIKAAKDYKEKYIDYEYLICSEGFVQKSYYIIDAQKDNFQHLTGVNSLISPKDFFDKCYNSTLQDLDFDFVKRGQSEKSVKGSVRRKIKALPDMMKLFESRLLVEENFRKNKIYCSFAAADGSCTLGFIEAKKARPKTLIKGNELKNPTSVDLILRKKSEEMLFTDIIVGDKDILNKYIDKIEDMLDDKLIKDCKEIIVTCCKS